MKQTVRILFLLTTFCALGTFVGKASAAGLRYAETDSIRISLLTCEAGNEIYALFGHTALRVENLTRGTDVVYNYGIFDFDSPNFAFRFALGETDYLLGRASFMNFAAGNFYKGLDINQLTFDLRQDEKLRLIRLLEENYLPENRRYRYNYFYDNCATRPRDKLEEAVEGEIVYADDMLNPHTGLTFRDMIHVYSEGHPWSRFGMDLCLGSKADEEVCLRLLCFVPFRMEDALRRAGISDSLGVVRPLVIDEELVLNSDESLNPNLEARFITPLQTTLLLLLIVVVCSVIEVRRKKTWWGIDVGLLVLTGLMGCVLAFMSIWSQHPAIAPNYLLIAFHPLHILLLPEVICRLRKGKVSRYLAAVGVVLIFFLLLHPLIPQNFNPAVLPLALCLLIRSVSNVCISRKLRR